MSDRVGLGPKHLYRILWDYSARNGDELSVARGELVAATLAPEAYWLIATNQQGKRGLIPENYVALVRTAPKQSKQRVEATSSKGASKKLPDGSADKPKQNLPRSPVGVASHEAENASKQKVHGVDASSVSHVAENVSKQTLPGSATRSKSYMKNKSKRTLAHGGNVTASGALKQSEKPPELPPFNKSILIKSPSILQIEDWEKKINIIRVVLSFVN